MSLQSIPKDISDLEKLNFNNYRKDFLLTSQKKKTDLNAILKIAEILRKFYRDNISTRVFQTGLGISIFKDKSTRTRFSFASATNMLGLTLHEFDEAKSQVSHGETVRETANMISFLSETIGIRDDKFIGRGHNYMKKVGAALEEGFQSEVLSHRPCVINLQCDKDHPTQTMSDLLHIKYNFRNKLENLKGKKIAMTWAYSPSYGKPLSVPQGIISLMIRYGMDVHLAHPEGYELMDDTVNLARENSKKSGGNFTVSNSMEEAFKDADVVYPKSWAPIKVMKERSNLIQENDTEGLKKLEQECLENNAQHKDWECDEDKMALTRNGEALYMHCLPADITGVSCKNGEVSARVFEKYRKKTYFEARYKPYVIAAMIIASRLRNPVAMLDYFYRKRNRRTGAFEL